MKIMAIDLGDVRTGLAVCDKFELLASPLCVIKESNFDIILKEIVNEIINNKIEEVIIGYPINMNGSIGDRAKKSELFSSELKKMIPNIPIKLWDERNTTKSATFFLRQTNTSKEKRKKIIDSVAATIILESYLDFKKGKKV